jgi:hypothetical protein
MRARLASTGRSIARRGAADFPAGALRPRRYSSIPVVNNVPTIEHCPKSVLKKWVGLMKNLIAAAGALFVGHAGIAACICAGRSTQ